MTIKELSQLKSLNKEIALEKMKLNSLNSKNDHIGVVGIGSLKKSEYQNEINELRAKIEAHLSQCFILYNKINDFINSIDDSNIRLIISLRFVNGLSWQQVAMHIGGGNTADGVRKACERYIKNLYLQ